MLEVLVTIVILAFGMLGLAGLQSKIFTAEMESYQRAQAVVLVNDMVERLNANRNAVGASYVPADPATTTTLGTQALGPTDTQPVACAATPAAPTAAQIALRDMCEWSNALKGAAETSGGASVGGMIGARGCITRLQAENANAGVCTPGIYLVTVAWQGLNPTSTPAAACGQNAFGSDDRYRRALSARVSIGLPSCQ